MARRKRATLTDVALQAGVSKTTVSQILNNRPISVSESTRQRVQEVAERLSYTPNALIRSLQSRRTEVIGVVAGTTGDADDWQSRLGAVNK